MPESNGTKLRSYVCVYLFIQRGDDILLSLRQNTKFEDGNWSMIAGHVEEGEMAKTAMVREAFEEADITIDPSDLEFIYMMDRKTLERQNIDIFFNCSKFQGEIHNNEPHKCGGIEFFKINNLPNNIAKYIKVAIGDILNGKHFGEFIAECLGITEEEVEEILK